MLFKYTWFDSSSWNFKDLVELLHDKRFIYEVIFNELARYHKQKVLYHVRFAFIF